jgi:hypothetical protein
MTREEAIDIRQRSLNRQPVSMAELDEAMRIIRSAAPPTGDDPWGLTPGMRKTLTAVVRTGSMSQAAIDLGVGHPAVSMQISRAVERMKVGNRMLALFEWVRFLQGAH